MKRRWVQRGVAALLNAVLLAMVTAVPFLDGVAIEYGAVIESEHGTCHYLRLHDHAICVQFGANAPLQAPVHDGLPPTPLAAGIDQGPAHESQLPAAPPLLPPTRAPPGT